MYSTVYTLYIHCPLHVRCFSVFRSVDLSSILFVFVCVGWLHSACFVCMDPSDGLIQMNELINK